MELSSYLEVAFAVNILLAWREVWARLFSVWEKARRQTFDAHLRRSRNLGQVAGLELDQDAMQSAYAALKHKREEVRDRSAWLSVSTAVGIALLLFFGYSWLPRWVVFLLLWVQPVGMAYMMSQDVILYWWTLGRPAAKFAQRAVDKISNIPD